MSKHDYRFAFVSFSLLGALAGCNRQSPTDTGDPRIPSQQGVRAPDYAHMPPAMAAQEWDMAVRAYPNKTIPPGIRRKALEARKQAAAAAAKATPADGVGSLSQGLVGSSTWWPIGPAGTSQDWFDGSSGRATAMALNPSNSNDLWVGTAGGGVWRGTVLPGTIRWEPQGEADISSEAIGAVVTDLDNQGHLVVWVGTGENAQRRDTYYGDGVYYHEDGQIEPFWSHTGNNSVIGNFHYGSIAALVGDPTTQAPSKILYAAVSGGNTASATESQNPAPDPNSGFGIFRYSQALDAWTAVPVQDNVAMVSTAGSRPTDLKIGREAGTTVLYAGFANKGFFRSTDGGATWSVFNTGIPAMDVANAEYPVISIYNPSQGANPVLFGLIGGPCPTPNGEQPPGNPPNPCGWECPLSIYKYANNTWTKVNTDTVCSYVSYTHDLLAITANDLYVAGLAMYHSTDGGVHWKGVGGHAAPGVACPQGKVSVPHSDHHQFVPVYSGGQLTRIYDLNDGGVYYSDPSSTRSQKICQNAECHPNGMTAYCCSVGDCWFGLNDGLQTMEVQTLSANNDTMLIANQDNGVDSFMSGAIWHHEFDSDGAYSIVDYLDPRVMVAGIQSIAPGGRFPALSYRAKGFREENVWLGGGTPPNGPLSFYPPMVQDRVPMHGPVWPLYWGTNQLYQGQIWPNVDGKGGGHIEWRELSNALGVPGALPQIPGGHDVITAIGVGDTHVYMGFFSGYVYYADSGSNYTTWARLMGGGTLPVAVVTSIAVDPWTDNAYVAFSGFGNKHIYRFATNGNWLDISNNQFNGVPVNALAFEDDGGDGVLWAGTDIGVYRTPLNAINWQHYGTGLPNVPIYSLQVDPTKNRILAGTHGRGVWVMAKPIVETPVSRPNNSIWDIPIYGQGFTPNNNNTKCTVTLKDNNGMVCSSSTKDARNDDIVVDSHGNLGTTALNGNYNGRKVVWACILGDCLGGINIGACPNLTTIEIACPNNPVFVQTLPGAHIKPNPASAGFFFGVGFGNSADPTVTLMPAVQSSDGTTRTLCSTTITYDLTETSQTVVNRAVNAINSSATCALANVAAEVMVSEPDGQETQEAGPAPYSFVVRDNNITGTQMIPAFAVEPGAATGACYTIKGWGVPSGGALVMPRISFKTPTFGAAGDGSISIYEEGALGTCQVTYHPTAAENATAVATGLLAKFNAGGNPGPGDCLSMQNSNDVERDGNDLVFVSPVSLTLCLGDSGVGAYMGPEEILWNQEGGNGGGGGNGAQPQRPGGAPGGVPGARHANGKSAQKERGRGERRNATTPARSAERRGKKSRPGRVSVPARPVTGAIDRPASWRDALAEAERR